MWTKPLPTTTDEWLDTRHRCFEIASFALVCGVGLSLTLVLFYKIPTPLFQMSAIIAERILVGLSPAVLFGGSIALLLKVSFVVFPDYYFNQE